MWQSRTPGSLGNGGRGEWQPCCGPPGRSVSLSLPPACRMTPTAGWGAGQQPRFRATGPCGPLERRHIGLPSPIRRYGGDHSMNRGPWRRERYPATPDPNDVEIRLYNHREKTRHAPPASTGRGCRDTPLPSPHRRIGASTLLVVGELLPPDCRLGQKRHPHRIGQPDQPERGEGAACRPAPSPVTGRLCCGRISVCCTK
jgi:hypothetical protein